MDEDAAFRKALLLAVANVIKFGDTDIFPFGFENHVIFDRSDDIVKLMESEFSDFNKAINSIPPQHIHSLVPVGFLGFRWATQIEPIWNLYFLANVLQIWERIENSRISTKENVVFSYRISPDIASGSIFNKEIGWTNFIHRSMELSEEYNFVVACDISELYPRLGHHRLENALRQAAPDTIQISNIMKFLGNFSNTNSYGLPVGGPASRIMSELTINQVDRLMISKSIKFVRFADDYHIFARTKEEAFQSIISLSELLFANQGLSLQKSKTRVMSGAEFRQTSPVRSVMSREHGTDSTNSTVSSDASLLMQFSLRYDPYSPNADEEYERLKDEIGKFDIVGMLKSELQKSRVHIALARKLVGAIRYLDQKNKDNTLISILENIDIIYPILSPVLILVSDIFDELSEEGGNRVVGQIIELIKNESYTMKIDIHLDLAIRVIARKHTPENVTLLQQIFDKSSSSMIRRDIIIVMAHWAEWYWLSDLKNRFRALGAAERRAFIMASYALSDEGKHWRKSMKSEFNPFEKLIATWMADRVEAGNRTFPL